MSETHTLITPQRHQKEHHRVLLCRSATSRIGRVTLASLFTLLFAPQLALLLAPQLAVSPKEMVKPLLTSRAYATPPVIHVVMRPRVQELKYRLDLHRATLVIEAHIVGERDELIPDVSVTLSHQCFGLVKARSDHRGYVQAALSLRSERYQRRGAGCVALLNALEEAEHLRVQLKGEMWNESPPQRATQLGPRIDWSVVIAESSISSRVRQDVTATHDPLLVTLNLHPPKFDPFPRVLPTSVSVSVSATISTPNVASSVTAQRSSSRDMSRPLKRSIAKTLRAQLSLSREISKGELKSQTHLEDIDNTLAEHLISLTSLLETQSETQSETQTPLKSAWEIDAPGAYRVHLALYTSAQREPIRSQSAPLMIYAPLSLSIAPPVIDSARRLVTMNGTLRPTGSDDALTSHVALDHVALGIRWQLSDQDLPSEQRTIGRFTPQALRRGQRVVIDDMQIVSPTRAGEWRQRFLLPPGQVARFEITPLSLVQISGGSREGEETWVVLSPSETTDWVEVDVSGARLWLWVLLIAILSERAYTMWRRREESTSTEERQLTRPREALTVGWTFEHDLNVLNSDDGSDVITLMVYNALTREPISGTISVVSPPATLNIPSQGLLALDIDSIYGVRLQFKPRDGQRLDHEHSSDEYAEYSVTSLGVQWSSAECKHHQGQILWVRAPGFEPLLAALPDRPEDAQRSGVWVLPLWPAREALGRLWGDLLSGLGVQLRYGVGDREQLTRALQLRGGTLLSSFGEQVDLALYADDEVTLSVLSTYMKRLLEISEALGPEHMLHHLTPPSDIRRALIQSPTVHGEDRS